MADYNIVDAGASADAAPAENAAAVQRAVDAAHAAGGGRVVIPAGTFQCGTIRLKSHVELHLEQGAV